MFFFVQKPVTFITQEMVGRKTLPEPSMNNIFNVLSIGLQCTVSFK